MGSLRSVILKSLVLAICAILLIWNGFQKNAVEEGSYLKQVEYQPFNKDAPIGVNAEASVLGMFKFGETYENRKLNYYYWAVLEDDSPALIYVTESEYRKEIIRQLEGNQLEDLLTMYDRNPVKLRGVTVAPPSLFEFGNFYEADEWDIDLLESNAMLVIDSSLKDSELIEPDIVKLPTAIEWILWIVGGFAGLLTILDICLIVMERKKHKDETWSCSTCGAENSYFQQACACGQPKPEPQTLQKENSEGLKDGWVCSCGREHPAYETGCVCGKSKLDAKKEALAKKKAEEQQVRIPD